MVNFGAGTLSFHFGTGGRGGLCQSGLPPGLYAGTQPIHSGASLYATGCLQWCLPKWDGDDGAVCTKAGAGDYYH